jgi:DNA-directed RNA polymerase subunit RPC12/RpoP
MKFLCIECDEPMKLMKSQGPDEGSLTVTFGCPECGHRVAMLTNPFETQMVRSLGVKVGGRTEPATPFEQLRAFMGAKRDGALQADGAARPLKDGRSAEELREGPGCPFAGMLAEQEAGGSAGIGWSPEAEARVERIPDFIRPMAKKAIERYAEGKGYQTITESVMDEARGALGM